MKNITVQSATEALRLAKTWERALSLRSGGYDFQPFFTHQECFFVFVSGELRYTTLVPHWDCNCPDFKRHRDYCKHLLCAEMICEENAQCAEHDVQSEAEIDFDPCFARF